MKKWMTFVVAVQVASALIWLAQAVRLWPDHLWFVSWILGVPGSVLGHWAADQLLWMRASHWIIGLAGLAAATLINLAVAYVLGAACKRIYKVSKRRRQLCSYPGNDQASSRGLQPGCGPIWAHNSAARKAASKDGS